MPLCDLQAMEDSRRAKEKNMTYIISGILNGKKFLMSDCVGTNKKPDGTRTFIYTNKLSKLISTNDETYFSHAGAESYSYAINCFDRGCYEKNKLFNFKNKEHISKILEIFEQVKIYYGNQSFKVGHYARLYFVNKTGVYYYDINDNGKLSKIKSLEDNYYIKPDITENIPVKLNKQFKDNDELLSFCKNEINKVQDYGIKLKGRFSYIIIDDNGIIFDNSIKSNRELALSLIGAKYDEIE